MQESDKELLKSAGSAAVDAIVTGIDVVLGEHPSHLALGVCRKPC